MLQEQYRIISVNTGENPAFLQTKLNELGAGGLESSFQCRQLVGARCGPIISFVSLIRSVSSNRIDGTTNRERLVSSTRKRGQEAAFDLLPN
jgi:hypothetical protein